MDNKATIIRVDRKLRTAGFSLIELVVTLAVFLVIAGAAFSLVQRHMPVFAAQQSQSALNFGLRNAAAQMQIDLGNAGSGFYASTEVPGWPVGVSIIPGSNTTSCYNSATHVYGSECFDILNVIKIDPNTPPAHIEKSNPGMMNSSNLFIEPTGSTTNAQLAAYYKTGDQILVVSADGLTMSTAILTADGDASGGKVKLQHRPTLDTGYNTPPTNPRDMAQLKASDDPLAISWAPAGLADLIAANKNKLKEQFDQADWVLKIAPVTYYVDASDSSNPKMMRDGEIVAEQVVGFKLGVQIFGDPEPGTSANECNPFCYDPASYNRDWSRVRSVRIAIVGRTSPRSNTAVVPNSFDGGPYRIEAITVVVHPRSLSLHDN